MTIQKPAPPKIARGDLRALKPAQLADESTYRHSLLENVALSGSLVAASFEGCVFREVRLSGAQWERARLKDVRFEGCDLSGAHLRDAALERVQFIDCRMLGLQLPELRARNVRLTGVNAGLSLWYKADTKALWFEDCDLSEASFLEAQLPAAVLRNCRLNKTNFSGALLTGADLRGSELRGARLSLREVAGVTVEAAQLLDLARLMNVEVKELQSGADEFTP